METPPAAARARAPLMVTPESGPLISARDVGFTYPTGRRALERYLLISPDLTASG